MFKFTLFLIVMTGFFLLVIIDKPTPEVQQQLDNKHFVSGHGKALVSRQLKDPESASFDGLVPHKNALCGYVNAKNSFGGYTGFSRFVSLVNRDVVMIEDSSNKSEFEMMWDIFCSAKDVI